METLTEKKYKVWVVPQLDEAKPDPNNAGAFLPQKANYIQMTNPDEAARAIKDQDGKTVFMPQRFIHLQVFEEGETLLGGDTKPATVNIFENVDPILFDKLESLIKTEGQHKIMPTAKQIMELNESLPGLVRNRKTGKYTATRRNKAGAMVPLMQNRRLADGNFVEEPVVRQVVTYFLFGNQVNPDDDEIQFINAKNRIKTWVGGTTPEDEAQAEKIAEVNEEERKTA